LPTCTELPPPLSPGVQEQTLGIPLCVSSLRSGLRPHHSCPYFPGETAQTVFIGLADGLSYASFLPSEVPTMGASPPIRSFGIFLVSPFSPSPRTAMSTRPQEIRLPWRGSRSVLLPPPKGRVVPSPVIPIHWQWLGTPPRHSGQLL